MQGISGQRWAKRWKAKNWQHRPGRPRQAVRGPGTERKMRQKSWGAEAAEALALMAAPEGPATVMSRQSLWRNFFRLVVTLSSGCPPKYAVLWFHVMSRESCETWGHTLRESLYMTRDIRQVSYLEFLNETACHTMSPSQSCHLTWCGYKGLAKPIDASQSSDNGQTCRKNLNTR